MDDFFHETKEKLEKISPVFSSCSHSHPGDPQPDTLNYSLRELIECVVLSETEPVFWGLL